MRLRIEVTPADPAAPTNGGEPPPAWIVRATNLETGKPIVDAGGQPIERPLGAAGAAPARFPLPPKAEGATAPASQELERLLRAFVVKTLKGDDLDRFAAYLFDTLLGAPLWKAIDAEADKDWVDLVLQLPAGENTITRLPWELMRNAGADAFLAISPMVSVTREVRSAATLPPLARTPRLLFVVGTNLNDDVVRPGAEYLQILRGLRTRHFNLKTRLLCKATAELVAITVDEFQPDIVHFIGHGAMDSSGRAYIELLDELNPAERRRAYAGDLRDMLRGKPPGLQPLPRMVVLSACYTAAINVSGTRPGEIAAGVVTPVGQVATPLAAQLVQDGVGVVVAMSGSVADRACRLFTRQFYGSIASEEDIARATALGRRAAFRGDGAKPTHGVDWAFPTVFVSSALDAAPRVLLGLEATSDTGRRLARWQSLATHWPYGVHPRFCDRFDVLERFDLLLADFAAQQELTKQVKAFSVLSIAVVEKESQDEKFGRSWLLRELAAKALADGHLPIVLSKVSGDAPTSFDQLLNEIVENTEQVLALVGLEDERFELLPLFRRPDPLPAGLQLPGELVGREQLRDENTVARALRLDLVRLLDRVRNMCRPAAEAAACKLVLFVDDVHRMGNGAHALLGHVIGKFGLSKAAADIRVVFTWALPAEPAAGQQTAIDAIKNWLQDQHELSRMSIGKFARRQTPQALSPVQREAEIREERLSYEYFLLHRALECLGWRGIATREQPADPGAAKLFWKYVSARFVRGVPSLLEPGMAQALQEVEDDNEIIEALFQPANDDHWLQQAREEKR